MKIDRPVVPTGDLGAGVFDPPDHLVGSEGRLIPVLRDAAQTKNPTQILARAAVELLKAPSQPSVPDRAVKVELGIALADLAVTGREAYRALGRGLDRAAVEKETERRLRTDSITPAAGQIRDVVDKVLDRAYAVAWALRGPAAQRPALRERLGWIAVSAEDDTPHRPVNLPPPPYEQYELPVRSGGLTLSTRFFIASAVEPAAARIPPQKRALPPDPVPEVPRDHEVILFLHGHSSGADEALAIVPDLLEEGRRRKKKYSIVSIDLPNNGYSETFDHTRVAPTNATTYPRVPTDNGPIETPILTFIENFVVAFVNRLDKVTPVKKRFAAVIGGSLGGNLGLRLGRRSDLGRNGWLGRAIVSWSPASVWMPKAKHTVDYLATDDCMKKCAEPETSTSRDAYFTQVYDKPPLPGVIDPQPEYWYRKDYPLKDFQVHMSRLSRREIYNANYRQWHWRVAAEQLVYSHFANESFGDATTPLRYTLNTVPMLLAAGSADNYFGTKIFDNTGKLGRLMTNLDGRMLPVLKTGHSIHAERPRYFAREIVKFLNRRSMQVTCVTRVEGRIREIGGTNRTDNKPFRMSVDECMTAMDQGDVFFVEDIAGTRAWVELRPRVSARRGGPRDFVITTGADTSTGDNLDSLPGCPANP